MTSQENYWVRRLQSGGVSRRRFVGGAALAGVGAAGIGLVGCGDDDSGGDPTKAGGNANLTPTNPTASAEAPVKGGTLRVLANIGSLLDPHTTNTPAESLALWGRVGNTLMRFSTKQPGATEGDLASGLPEVAGDGTLLTFKIRPEAKWQNRAPVNGRAVTAEDVKLSFERIKDPATVSPRAGQFGNIDSMTVIDANTLQMKLKVPQADLFAVMSDQYNFIIPKETAVKGKEAIKTAADVIGSGPYELESFTAAQKFVLKRRADAYWRPNTSWLEGFEYTHQTDSQQLANALRAGQVDTVGLPVDLVKTFEGDKNFIITKAPSPARECLLINHGKDRYKDPKVRLALSRAINRAQVYESVFGGGGVVGGPFTPAGPFWALPEAELKKLPGFGDRATEIREAKALLSAAGFPNGFEETIITVTAFLAEKVHEIVVSNLRDIGVTVKTENVGTDFGANILPRQVKREYNLATTIFLSGAYPDAQLVLYHHSDVKTKGTRNYGDYASPALDVKLDKQSTMYDLPARQQLVYEIQRDLLNAPGPVWLGSRSVFNVWSTKLRNVQQYSFASGFWEAENVWIKA